MLGRSLTTRVRSLRIASISRRLLSSAPPVPPPQPPKRSKTVLYSTLLLGTGAAAYWYSTNTTSSASTSMTRPPKPSETVSTDPPGLSKEAVNARLKQSEKTVIVSKDLKFGSTKSWFSGNEEGGEEGWVLRWDLSQVASNSPIEDYRTENKLPFGMLFGVFDGHGGTECATIVSSLLPSYVASALSKLPAPTTIPTNASEDVVDPTRKSLISKALQDAFTKLDADIINGAVDVHVPPLMNFVGAEAGVNTRVANEDHRIRSHLRVVLAGSCALVCYVEGRDLYVACTGDSRAVLGRRAASGVFEALDLSADQTVKNAEEYGRLLDEHPGELETVVVRGRVLGGLMPTRAFGDARYKWPLSVQSTILPYISSRPPPKNYLTPPYVTALPEVTHYRIQPSRDLFLVMATDGLYDELKSSQVVESMAAYMLKKQMVPPPAHPWSTFAENSNSASADSLKGAYATEDENAATHLIRNALGGVDEGKVSKLLGIPAPYSRRFRDDMTVTVLFFGQHGLKASEGLDVEKVVGVQKELVRVVEGAEKGLEGVDLKKAGAKRWRLEEWVKYFARKSDGKARL
ncbi:hypothetical protein HDV05_001618 [Chytridiales sp. JEL 0842]|nr:hypothetical protein HDV05_001618 [Chytridiales sp. JEL 0842]